MTSNDGKALAFSTFNLRLAAGAQSGNMSAVDDIVTSIDNEWDIIGLQEVQRSSTLSEERSTFLQYPLEGGHELWVYPSFGKIKCVGFIIHKKWLSNVKAVYSDPK